MIATFPEFTSVSLSLKDEIQTFVRKFEAYADVSFINLFAWDTDQNSEVSWLNGNLVIRLPDYMDNSKHFCTFIGKNKLKETIDILLENFSKLELVPDTIVHNLEQAHDYAIAEDRDNFEYLYDVDDLANLAGKRYKTKRNVANGTRKSLEENLTFETLTKVTPDLKREIRAVAKRWFKSTKQDGENIKMEAIALDRLLRHFNQLDLHITLARIDGNLVGFSIHEIVSRKYSICHFEKAMNDINSGINTVLIQEAAKFLSNKSKIVNWQQDLGIEGIKKAKRAYRPIGYLRKYTISH